MRKLHFLHVLRCSLAIVLSWLALPCSASASQKIITLAPHATELIFAAGAGDQITATVQSSDYPPQAREIPRIGDGVHINVETLLAMQPDIVIAWLPTEAVQALKPGLSAAGIQLLFSTPRKLDDIPNDIRRFGKLLHSPQA